MTETARHSNLVEFAELWEASELPERSVAPLVAALQRGDAIAREAAVAEAGARKVTRSVGEEIAVGTYSFQEGLEEAQRRALYASQVTMSQRVALGKVLVADARAACHSTAKAFLADNAAKLAAEAEGSIGADSIRRWLEEFAGLERIGAPA